MRVLKNPGRWAAVAAAVVMIAAGCSPEERSFQNTGGGGAGTGGGPGSGGGAPAGDFVFAVVPLEAKVPYEGYNLIEVTVTRGAGFEGAVEVTAEAPPAGLTAEPLVIPPGDSSGAFRVGASGNLQIGAKFTLKLSARSGDLVRTAEVPATVTGKFGTLDTTFAGTGVYSRVLGPDGGPLLDVLALNEGGIVASGARYGIGGSVFAVVKVSDGGVPDAGFGMNGLKTTQFCQCSESATAVAVGRQVSGKIVAAGPRLQAGRDLALARYRDSGLEDAPFGDGQGTQVQDLGAEEEAFDMVVAPDDKLVLVGTQNDQFLVARFTAEGWPDGTFGNGSGYATFAVPGQARAAAIDGQGRIVIAGTAVGANQSEVAVLRLLPDGSVDTSFGDGSASVVLLGSPQTNEHAAAVAILPDGDILVAGDTTGGGGDFVVSRLREGGAIDATFGAGGYAIVSATDGIDEATDMEVLPDGRVVVLGNTISGNQTLGIALVRLQPDGKLDPTFGEGGIAQPFVGAGPHAWGLDAQADGKLVIAGEAGEAYPAPGIIARLWN